jgi:hypothetical protein
MEEDGVMEREGMGLENAGNEGGMDMMVDRKHIREVRTRSEPG